ncbi:MAG TPA: vanadium-dependent haloperoxidase [Candidatus Limnocylindria bacterium]|nr:vanadium-dependent haloperoxidase [Candidatus Limnocylindria bacterium]
MNKQIAGAGEPQEVDGAWTKRQISRRKLLTNAVAGAVVLTPVRWISLPGAGVGGAAASSRPVMATEFDAAVPTAWFDLVGRLIKGTPGYTPPVASRALGCLGVGLYESLAPGMPGHRSLAGILNALGPMPAAGQNAAYHWPSVANAALASMTRGLFPTAPSALQAQINDLEAQLAGGAPQGIQTRSIDRGRAVAAAVDAWSRGDGGHEGYLRNFPTDYVPPQGDGLWVPTAPGFLRAMQPYWGQNRPMALSSAAVGDPGPPPPFSTETGSAFYGEAHEVYTTVNGLNAERRDIALFWADDPVNTATPPGHWSSIATQILRSQDRSLADAAVTYLRVGVGVCDAFIACWRVKFIHNLIRPISYIRSYIDAGWGNPLPVTTPPFPEYTSGHSVQSGASATVMTATFGPLAFTDHTHDERGLAPRSFSSFEAAAQEAAISRLYGGIHYRAAIDRGIEQGRRIGAAVAALPLQG